MSAFKKGQLVAVINQTIGGRFFVETYYAFVISRVRGSEQHLVRIGPDIVYRFLEPAAQRDPAAFVASLNGQLHSEGAA